MRRDELARPRCRVLCRLRHPPRLEGLRHHENPALHHRLAADASHPGLGRQGPQAIRPVVARFIAFTAGYNLYARLPHLLVDIRVLPYYYITMITSRLTSKYQATIPGQVREILGVGRGDSIAFSIADGKVILEKVEPVDTDFLRMLDRTLDDWNSPEDDDAFRNL